MNKDKIILVTDVKVVEHFLSEDVAIERWLSHDERYGKYPVGEAVNPFEATVEEYRATDFPYMKNGVRLAWRDNVQELIGKPFEIILELKEDLANSNSKNRMLMRSIIAYEKMNFWQRIEFIFFKNSVVDKNRPRYPLYDFE